MRPYTARGKSYVVPIHGRPSVIRPTKNAAGMSYTAARSGHSLKKMDIVTLVVRGTLEQPESKRSMMFRVERSVCPCCKQKTGPLRLKRSR